MKYANEIEKQYAWDLLYDFAYERAENVISPHLYAKQFADDWIDEADVDNLEESMLV